MIQCFTIKLNQYFRTRDKPDGKVRTTHNSSHPKKSRTIQKTDCNPELQSLTSSTSYTVQQHPSVPTRKCVPNKPSSAYIRTACWVSTHFKSDGSYVYALDDESLIEATSSALHSFPKRTAELGAPYKLCDDDGVPKTIVYQKENYELPQSGYSANESPEYLRNEGQVLPVFWSPQGSSDISEWESVSLITDVTSYVSSVEDVFLQHTPMIKHAASPPLSEILWPELEQSPIVFDSPSSYDQKKSVPKWRSHDGYYSAPTGSKSRFRFGLKHHLTEVSNASPSSLQSFPQRDSFMADNKYNADAIPYVTPLRSSRLNELCNDQEIDLNTLSPDLKHIFAPHVKKRKH